MAAMIKESKASSSKKLMATGSFIALGLLAGCGSSDDGAGVRSVNDDDSSESGSSSETESDSSSSSGTEEETETDE